MFTFSAGAIDWTKINPELIAMLVVELKPGDSIPIPGGRSLHPVENGGFVKGIDQNFSLIFTAGQSTPLTKLRPLIFTRQSTRGEVIKHRKGE